MPLTQDQQNRISEVVKDILLRRIDNFPEYGCTIRNATIPQRISRMF